MFRRVYNVLRYRISDVNSTKPGDFFFSKDGANATETAPKDKPVEIVSRLSFDPSLPAYYRVSVFLLFFEKSTQL